MVDDAPSDRQKWLRWEAKKAADTLCREPRLGRARGSAYPQFCAELGRDLHAMGIPEDLVNQGVNLLVASSHEVFVVEHDWAAALGPGLPSVAKLADVQLPFPRCAFEFNYSGTRVIALTDGASLITYARFIHGWAPAQRLPVERQIVAICIAIEAEIAEAVSADTSRKPNSSAVRRGHAPRSSYRVVRLRGRTKGRRSGGTQGGRRVRLHFRRGHWRHFATSKKWIKWTLVGDPDLGFIGKHYRV